MASPETFQNIAAYIARIDNPYTLFQHYTKGHTPLELLTDTSTEDVDDLLNAKCSEKIITSKQLDGIIVKLIELQQSDIQVESTRIPLLEQEFKFKGYRRVEFKYEDNMGLHTLMITHKKKEIALGVEVKRCNNQNVDT